MAIEILGPVPKSSFHDSSLINISIGPRLEKIEIVVSTPDVNDVQALWQITFCGVLRFEFETMGSGKADMDEFPLEVYDIYHDPCDTESRRWRERFAGEDQEEKPSIYHVILASSLIRGWGEHEDLEGISIVCREIRIQRADHRFQGQEYSRPRIDGNNSE